MMLRACSGANREQFCKSVRKFPHASVYTHNRTLALLTFYLISAHVVRAAIQPRPGSSSSSGRDRGKHSWGTGPSPGFTGGQALDNNIVQWCDSAQLPGCQSCADGTRCTACWVQYPDATGSSFVLNRFTGQCDCPPGHGLWPTLPPPTWPGPGRHLLAQLPALPDLNQSLVLTPAAAAAAAAVAGTQTLEASLAPTAVASERQLPGQDMSEVVSLKAALAAANVTELALLQDVKPGLWLPDPLPAWSQNCMPCPVNYYSPGGQQGFAQCRPCPGSFTTAGATAAANCLFPFCGPGQEPTRRLGKCRACPLGTYSSATANNQPCYPCPKGFTTAATGSRSFAECRVPTCGPGQELNLDLLVCYPCRGNTISPGGKVSQGTLQPRCQECPWGTAANGTRTVCYTGTCPYPDAFKITCQKDNLLNQTSYFPCGPNGKPAHISQYCTAYPPGSVLAFYEPRTVTSNGGLSQEISCPAGANNSNVKFPVIVSFNGRTDCVCSTDTSCWFISGQEARVAFPGGSANARLVNSLINITIPDRQASSLEAIVRGMAGTNSTAAYTALYKGYCGTQQKITNEAEITAAGVPLPQPSRGERQNWTNPLQVNCSSSYITRIELKRALPAGVLNGNWTDNGRLPSAALLRGLSQLRMLSCPSCGIDGTLPRDWGTQDSLMELRDLDLSGNNFTGTLPETWGYMVNLQRLTISSFNGSTMGTIPAAWGYMRSLEFVNMTGLYLSNGTDSCAPWQWQIVNALVWGETLLPPANYGTMSFCPEPEPEAATAAEMAGRVV